MADDFFPCILQKFKLVIMVDPRFSRQISPAASLENYKSAGENIKNVRAIS